MTATRFIPMFTLLLVSVGLGACPDAKRQKAANAYKKELRAHRARFQHFQDRYPAIENRLKQLRQESPKGVARLIRQKMLPLLDALVKGFDPMIAKGQAYVALLPDSVEAKPRLKAQFQVFRRQQEIVATIHKTYVDEADLFSKGKPNADDLQQLFNRRIAAAQRMQQTTEK